MACGDALLAKYAITPDGHTLANPWTGFAGPLDYEDWRVVAANMWQLMHRAFVALGDVEGRRVEAGTLTWASSKWNELVETAGNQGTLRQRLDAFATPIVESFSDWPSLTWDSTITSLLNLIRDIACTWEQIETAIASYEPSKIPPHPASPGPARRGLNGWGLLILAGLAWYVWGGGDRVLAGGSDDE